MAIISKQQIKFIHSLHQKKYRQMYGKFLVEGDKAVRELILSSFTIDAIYALPQWIAAHSPDVEQLHTVTKGELLQLSTHDNPNQVLAIAQIPSLLLNVALGEELYIACDQINDPGNAGTIIRIADWFGISTVIFSEDTVDVYNPKVVSAAKGSLFRVRVVYTPLAELFNSTTLPVIGAVMHGENIYDADLPAAGILLIGNEANGISDALYPHLTRKISIPAFGKAESLNAGVATGIMVSEWRRKLQ